MTFTPVASYPNFGMTKAVPPTAFPASLANSASWDSNLIPAAFGGVALCGLADQSGVVFTIQRYADLAGTIPVGPTGTFTSVANTANSCWVLDGIPYLSFNCNVLNSSGSTVNLSNMSIVTGSSLAP